MEIKVFKYYEDKHHDFPKDYTLVYYNPGIKTFAFYACSFLSEDYKNYRFEGPDKDLIKYLDGYLKHKNNVLSIQYSVPVDEGFAIVNEPVEMSDPNYFEAFYETVVMAAMGKKHFYTTNPNYKKVNSIKDVKRLDAEYAAQNEQQE